jgi:hypothetical protein
MADRLTNNTLVDFVLSVPLKNRRRGLFVACRFDRREESVDTFFWDLAPLIDFTLVTPFKFIKEASFLFDGSEIITRVLSQMLRYLVALIENPALIDASYTADRLLREFSAFLCSPEIRRCNSKWLQSFSEAIGKNVQVTAFLVRTLDSILVTYRTTLYADLSVPVNAIAWLLRFPTVSEYLWSASRFAGLMHELFGRSLLPGANSEYATYFPGQGTEPIPQEALFRLDRATSAYHTALATVIESLMNPSFRQHLFAWLRDQITFFHWDHSSPMTFEVELFPLAYNLEGCLLECTIRLCQDAGRSWASLNPFTPHLPGAIGQSTPSLAVRHVNPWVQPQNEREFHSHVENTDPDPEEDREQAESSWRAAVSSAPPADDLSQLFFATANIISYAICRYVEVVYLIEERVERSHIDLAKRLLFRFIVMFYSIPSRRKNMREFLFATLRFLLRIGQFDESSRTFRTKWPPPEYQRLPAYLGNVGCDVLPFFYMTGRFEGSPVTELQLLGHLFSSHLYLKDPYQRISVLKMIFAVSKSPRQEDVYLTCLPTLLREVYPEVLQFFGAAQYTGAPHHYELGVEIQELCLCLLAFWFKFEPPQKYFAEHCHEDASVKFLSDLMGRTNAIVTDCPGAFAQPETALKATLRNLKGHFDVLQRISSFASVAFAAPKIHTSFARFVVFAFTRYLACELMHREWKSYEYTPLSYLLPLVTMCVKVAQTAPQLLPVLRREAGGWELFGQIASELAPLPFDSMDITKLAFKKFVEALREAEAGKEVGDDVPEDGFPDEFMDPVTWQFMRNPVQLPAVPPFPPTFIDRTTLEALEMGSGLIDPVRHTPFRIEDVVPAEELAVRIQTWLAFWRKSR